MHRSLGLKLTKLLSCPDQFPRPEHLPSSSPVYKELSLPSEIPCFACSAVLPPRSSRTGSLTQKRISPGHREGVIRHSGKNQAFRVKTTQSESWLRPFLVWELGQSLAPLGLSFLMGQRGWMSWSPRSCRLCHVVVFVRKVL